MRFSSLILKNLVRRPTRTVLTLMALATAIASVVALLGIARGFTSSFAEVYAAHSIDVVVSRAGSADRLSSSVDAFFAEEIAEIESVQKTAAVLLESMSLEEQGIYGIPAMGVASNSWMLADYEYRDQVDLQSSQIEADAPAAADVPKILLGIHLADRLEMQVGETLTIFDEPYLIGGVFQSPATWENGAMVFPIEVLQQLTDRRGQATYINVVLEGPVSAEDAQEAIEQIKQLDSKLLPMATSDFVETDTRMRLAGAMAWMNSVIALIIGSIGTLNTMLMSVMERTKEIGILRAIGWPKSRVIRMVLLESCGLAILASLIGTVLAVGGTWALSQAPLVKGLLVPVFDWQVFAQGFTLALGIGLLGATLPAWRAAQLLPTEAFREN